MVKVKVHHRSELTPKFEADPVPKSSRHTWQSRFSSIGRVPSPTFDRSTIRQTRVNFRNLLKQSLTTCAPNLPTHEGTEVLGDPLYIRDFTLRLTRPGIETLMLES